MTPGQRCSYFLLWADVCKAQGWSSKDKPKRAETTARCMSEIGGPATASTTDLGQAEITALFCYLTYLKTAEADLDAAARWIDCKQDYKAFALAKNADWHEERLYGKSSKPNKLDRNRFAGAKSATGEPLDKFDPEAIKKRHLTMASRHQKRARAQGQPKPAAPSRPDGARTAPASRPTPRIAPAPTPAPEHAAAAWDGEF